MSARRALVLASLLTLGAAPSPAPVRAWLTSADGAQRLAPVVVSRPQRGATTITVDAAKRYQSMVGFGAAITDASAILIQGLPPARRAALLQDLFGRGDGELGLNFTRLTIGASDFSPEHYSFDDMPTGQRDPDLARFSIAPNAKTVLPTVRQALAIDPGLVVMASPWSPPGWMKTGDSMVGGVLNPADYGIYARYFVRYLKAYAAAGVPMRYVTVQNEPDFSPKDYPGMRWPAIDRARFIGRDLGPALAQAKLGTEVLEWDHNWDQPEQPETVLTDPAAARHVAGVAWHCYAGDVAAQTRVQVKHPDKDVFFTECSGGGWRPGWKTGFGDTIQRLMIGSTRRWARGVLLWNLALNPKGGPHKGGCNNCRGVVTIDPATGTVTRELEYYALGHLSRFVAPGARRIATTSTTQLPTVAFRNPDGGLVLLAYNATDTAASLRVASGRHPFGYSFPPGAAVTFAWRP
ncbi:glycoside hydrolase family 30 beta sandwich domain-containing protein [Sphingomonas sp. Ant20]|uniref:glycoside hydrolase family 30 protein n=1 Tax=Sphingomonas sp. Ant20 TaxID=104605 RepID=UPI0005376994|nr:glycoside hydrolase family 30 beta sandwich domain-containing protein [Sphingomonas sp. Ant20]KHA63627.1 glycosyl hydrolase [Sphingomonas sp. Ant20]